MGNLRHGQSAAQPPPEIPTEASTRMRPSLRRSLSRMQTWVQSAEETEEADSGAQFKAISAWSQSGHPADNGTDALEGRRSTAPGSPRESVSIIRHNLPDLKRGGGSTHTSANPSSTVLPPRDESHREHQTTNPNSSHLPTPLDEGPTSPFGLQSRSKDADFGKNNRNGGKLGGTTDGGASTTLQQSVIDASPERVSPTGQSPNTHVRDFHNPLQRFSVDTNATYFPPKLMSQPGDTQWTRLKKYVLRLENGSRKPLATIAAICGVIIVPFVIFSAVWGAVGKRKS